MNKKRLLVFSNNPISLNNSNGRSIFNLLKEFRDYEILNLFIHNGDTTLSQFKFYRISDKDVLNVLLKRKTLTDEEIPHRPITAQSKLKIKHKKTSFKMLIRGFLWQKRRFRTEFINMVKKMNPDILIYQVGDSYSFNDMAITIKDVLNIPMIIYDTEDYFFKNWDYIKARNFKGIFFRFYKRKYDNSFKSLISKTDKAVFLTEDLEQLHKYKFPYLNTISIYNSHSDVTLKNDKKTGLITYSGNLEVGRLESLISISKILSKIDSNLIITVCSQTKQKSILSKFKNINNVNFIGEISYEENLKLLSESQLILLIESFDPFYIRDTKHAFSSKIPDCLYTLNSILVYSPVSCTVNKYFKKYNCGWNCDNLHSLEESLKEIISLNFENKYKNYAVSVNELNHDPSLNSHKMLMAVEELL